MTKNYSEAVIAEAARRSLVSPETVKHRLSIKGTVTTALCDLIQETQKPPIDTVLEEARERWAEKCEECEAPTTARYCRAGILDTKPTILVAIDLINERNALQAEIDALRSNELAEQLLADDVEDDPLDPHAPLEARHKDGRIVPVGLKHIEPCGSLRIQLNEGVCTSGGWYVEYFQPDGTHWSGEWALHNRVQP